MDEVTAESRAGLIGPINLDEKCAGARNAGNPHVACDEAGAGNELTEWLVRHSQRKRGATDRPVLRSTAPVLDPTRCYGPVFSEGMTPAQMFIARGASQSLANLAVTAPRPARPVLTARVAPWVVTGL